MWLALDFLGQKCLESGYVEEPEDPEELEEPQEESEAEFEVDVNGTCRRY